MVLRSTAQPTCSTYPSLRVFACSKFRHIPNNWPCSLSALGINLLGRGWAISASLTCILHTVRCLDHRASQQDKALSQHTTLPQVWIRLFL